jgi:uncharacterized protein (TIGR02284 family)
MDTANDVSVLNNLIKTTLDSVKGFRDAAEGAEGSRFTSLFTQMASDRERVVSELQEVVRQRGGTPEDSSSIAGAAHRTFMNLKDMLVARDEKAIINEVERGEDYIKAKYEAAIADANLPVETRAVVERCFASVREGHDRVSALKHSMA